MSNLNALIPPLSFNLTRSLEISNADQTDYFSQTKRIVEIPEEFSEGISDWV